MITLDIAVKFITLFVSATALFGIVWRTFKKADEVNSNQEEIEAIKTEQQIICYGLLACLDGLKQLGANGNVTKAHNELEKHINKQAHI